ncbi:MAG: hypothetical protein BYD32DRAFT_218799 [Podila humilis]|nr:MAG: hypothetical protein BYD32DRAFT_218799 [Podila humilis]
MDCNWCAVCSKHFHSDTQASLYCSEECRKADALACCEFHGCDHPDSTTHHDHLTFCHHHRPAIRIPSFPLSLNPKPSLEQLTHGQYQNDEWTRFLQQQYNNHNFNHNHNHSTLHVQSATGQMPSSQLSHSLNNFSDKYTQSNTPFLTPPLFSSQQPLIVCGGANRGDNLHTIDCAARTTPFTSPKHAYQRQSIPLHALILNKAHSTSLADHCSGSSTKHPTSTSILELSSGGHECEQPCVTRKNKVLPPPTLSPMLPVTISNPASLNPAAPSPQKPERRVSFTTMSMASHRRSNSSGSFTSTKSTTSDPDLDKPYEDDNSDVTQAWPTKDMFFFPDHCCRTFACGQKKKQPQNNNKASRRQSVSELPPPPVKRDSSDNPFLALSASIWGNGWHQVEPLPASFVKTIQRSNLAGYGCEREGRSHRHRARYQNNNQHQTSGQNCQHNCAKNGDAGHVRVRQRSHHHNNHNNAKAVNADASSWATICSNRLPRSLQFID